MATAEACMELCHGWDDCDHMTYHTDENSSLIRRRTCKLWRWLNSGEVVTFIERTNRLSAIRNVTLCYSTGIYAP